MKVFISWSGRRSHEVAKALAGWLKKVVQSSEPWVSSEMERGVKWLSEISSSLDVHSIGILCVTPGNVSAPWLNYEAGALSKHLGDGGRVIPYLLDFRSASELQPPLGQFNASLANEEGTFDLLKTLNAHSGSRLSDGDLAETFKMWWPLLRDELEAIKSSVNGQPLKRRTTDDKLNEVLTLMRQLSRHQSNDLATRLVADPAYLRRDDVKVRIHRELMASRSVVIVGPTGSGKTHMVIDAVASLPSGWTIIKPRVSSELDDLLAGEPANPTLVLLDDVDQYIDESGLSWQQIDGLARAGYVVLATVRPAVYDRLSSNQTFGDDALTPARLTAIRI
jgi:hypothetical protein